MSEEFSSEYKSAAPYVSPDKRRKNWEFAIGLQATDGLQVSSDVYDLVDKYVAGDMSLDDTRRYLYEKYHTSQDGVLVSPSHEAQADLVSQRIAELLERAPFSYQPEFLSTIHHYLFQDLDEQIFHPGVFKTERMIKQEAILNGDSVLYADPLMYDSSLAYLFRELAKLQYEQTLSGVAAQKFVHLIACIWQVHPFYEGNTRSVAVLSELFLQSMGYDTTNEPVEVHARYFRDALVRAMYRNQKAGIGPDESYLKKFYENVFAGGEFTLNPEELVCRALIEHPEFVRNVNPSEAFSLQGKQQ